MNKHKLKARLNGIFILLIMLACATFNLHAQIIVQVGTGTGAQGTTGLTPYGTLYEDGKATYLIRKSELNALGVAAGSITSLAFNVTVVPNPALAGFTIKMAHTNVTTLVGYVTASFTTVYTTASTLPGIGWATYNFSNTFAYNDVDNIVIEVCYDNASWVSNGTVQSSTTTFNSVYGTYMDGGVGCAPGLLANISAATTERPNMRLGYIPGGGGAGGGNPFLAPPIAAFAYDKGIDTVWVNSPYAFVNNSTGDSAAYWRVEGQPGANKCVPDYNKCYHQISNTVRNFRYSFSDTGSYLVTLAIR
ncbi:MAG: hypothetical protein KBG11_08710, partial [Bacteroidia bacterium]|nr:hypothetical protein [Bacteroidia bacterium]